jgi:hypothetical protein
MENRVVLITYRDSPRGTEVVKFFSRVLGPDGVSGCYLREDNGDAVVEFSARLNDLVESLPEAKPVWIINETVAGDWISFQALMDETEAEAPDLAIYSEGNAQNPELLLAPILMIGSEIIMAWKRERSTETGGHSLAGKLCRILEGEASGQLLDWSNHRAMRRHFREVTEPLAKPGIRWPMLDDSERALIFCKYSDLGARVGHQISQFKGERRRRWFAGDVERWTFWFSSPSPARVLQVGDVDGIGACVLLSKIYPHPESEVHIITCSHEPSPNIATNAEIADKSKSISVYEGSGIEILAWMICEEGFWEGFDFIVLNCGDSPDALLTNCCQAWYLLKPGGTMVFDCTSNIADEPHLLRKTVESFIATFGIYAEMKLAGELIVIRKTMSVVNSEVQNVI